MPSIDEYPLRADGEGPPPDEERSSSMKWIVLAGLLVVAAIVAAVVLLRSPSPEEAPVTATTAPTEQSAEAATLPPLGSAPAAETELPPLDLTDPVVRELLRGLSSRPELVAWLATDNLLRHGVAAVDNVARGRTPTSHFRAVAPGNAFSATPSGNRTFTIAPEAYARYNGIAQTIDSLDAQGVSSAYATLRPRMIEAYRELGYPDGNIDGAVQRAIVHLLQTPDVAEDAPVEPSAVMYKYVEPRLEALSPAQKQLLRMGPANVRIVKQKLREIALALGIPSEQLPPAQEP
jgi:hypothetical protein